MRVTVARRGRDSASGPRNAMTGAQGGARLSARLERGILRPSQVGPGAPARRRRTSERLEPARGVQTQPRSKIPYRTRTGVYAPTARPRRRRCGPRRVGSGPAPLASRPPAGTEAGWTRQGKAGFPLRPSPSGRTPRALGLAKAHRRHGDGRAFKPFAATVDRAGWNTGGSNGPVGRPTRHGRRARPRGRPG